MGSDLNHRASSNPAKGNEEKLGLPEVRPGGGHLEMGGVVEEDTGGLYSLPGGDGRAQDRGVAGQSSPLCFCLSESRVG